jgi:MoaA/NifB/PqqE/SkfB family radical SAM enzyme
MEFQKTNRAAYLNFLRAKYAMLTGEVLVPSYPYYMGIDPTSICQLRCPSCPTGVENESRRSGPRLHLRNRTMMASDLLHSLLDELGEYLFFVMFYNWGEPLLNRALPSFIRRAKEHGIVTEVHTNLSLRLSDQYLEDLLTSGLDTLAASVDGFSQETYQIYRRGGNLALVRANLERLAALRQKLGLTTEIVWNILVFSFNEHELAETERYCRDLGITFNRREAFIGNPEWLPSYRKHEATPPPPAADPPAAPAPRTPAPCAWHYSYSFVNADGAVSPCCLPWDQAEDFGTVKPHTVSFADVWNNNLYRKSRGVFAGKDVRGLEKIETICTRCPWGPDIQHMYSHLDVRVLGQFQRLYAGKDPLLERAFDLLASPASFVDFYERHAYRLGSDAPRPDDAALVPRPPAGPAGAGPHPGYWRFKDRLKPYTGTLWYRYPRIYRWGKALEAKLIGRR